MWWCSKPPLAIHPDLRLIGHSRETGIGCCLHITSFSCRSWPVNTLSQSTEVRERWWWTSTSIIFIHMCVHMCATHTHTHPRLFVDFSRVCRLTIEDEIFRGFHFKITFIPSVPSLGLGIQQVPNTKKLLIRNDGSSSQRQGQRALICLFCTLSTLTEILRWSLTYPSCFLLATFPSVFSCCY